MPIQCVWFDRTPDGPWMPGWCFPHGYALSKRYLALPEPRRAAISVVLPNRRRNAEPGVLFCVDRYPSSDPDGAWDVTIVGDLIDGERPDLTVYPSINAESIYHGWLTNGVLSDDG